MKRFFYNVGLLVAVGFAVAVCASCGKDDDASKNGGSTLNMGGASVGGVFTIAASNVSGNTQAIHTVKADIEDWLQPQAVFVNNGFSLQLPTAIDSKDLYLCANDAQEGVAISDRNAQWTWLNRIYAYNQNDSKIGDIDLYWENENSDCYVSWVYVDRNVSITGNDEGGIYNLNLKKGWNVVYDFEDYTNDVNTITSTKPSGVNLQWEFDSYTKSMIVKSGATLVKKHRNK
ncbi:MAG: hypothetical protein LBU90_06035 [Bacteroidales bacterium]|jgi:hypothetical protein|nr:hypothetical protein [Bacteroidales bacterium]